MRNSVDNFSFAGLQAVEKEYAFEDPNDLNKKKVIEKTFWRKFRENVLDNDNAWIKLFLFASCSSAILILILECIICALFFNKFELIKYNEDDFNPVLAIYGYYRSYLKEKRYAMAAYLALYIYAELYQIAVTLIVLYTRNVYHLTSFLLFLAAMAVYAGIQYNEINTTITSFTAYSQLFSSPVGALEDGTQDAKIHIRRLSISVMIIATLACIIKSAIGFKLKEKFEKFTGEAIGNNRKLLQANTFFNLHRDTLLLALFFAPGYFLQAAIITPTKKGPEFAFTLSAIIISFVAIIGADYSTSNELRVYSAISSTLCLLGLGFIIFKLVEVYSSSGSNDDFPGMKSVIAFGVITAFLLLCLMAFLIQVIKNFGLGLSQVYAKNYHWKKSKSDETTKINSDKTITEPNTIKNIAILDNADSKIDRIESSGNSNIKKLPQRDELQF
uniref:Copper transport protein 86 n=1 Tax=Ogataea thermomethanolica (nom. inval.) TaxID=310468 RepID=A0A5P8D0U2_9ASCO|nr:copper transport protein 86 [Ogataea thermomethanolica (nom. inval.)]QGW56838.1 copper transport protein 86 [Ogataea thermomethanolica (nom. inval.)]